MRKQTLFLESVHKIGKKQVLDFIQQYDAGRK